REMEGEFSSYWLSDKQVYLLSDAVEKVELRCIVAENLYVQGNSESAACEEWIAYKDDDAHELAEWIKQRNLSRRDDKATLTSYFKIRPSRLAGVDWPPQNFREVLQWLSEVDPGARSRVLNNFVNNPVKRHVLLFDVHHQDLIGLYVEIDLEATGLNTYAKKKNQKKHTGRHVKHGTLNSCHSAKHSIRKFIRLGVTRADRKTILSRNRRRSSIGDLSTKRIALIGCGTIGGYLAGLLLRSGAGCGKARFDIYDPDSFG